MTLSDPASTPATIQPVLADRCNTVKKNNAHLFTTSRPLRYDERKRLIEQGNWSSDWNALKVAPGFIPDNIRNSHFSGKCYLGVFNGSPRVLPSGAPSTTGIFNSHIHNTVLENECSIDRCAIISNFHIASGALLHNCGSVSTTDTPSFGSGTFLTIGNETGGREVCIFAEMSFQDAAEATSTPALRNKWNTIAEHTAKSCVLPFGLIDENACIANCPSVVNTIVGPAAEINNTTQLENCTILSSTAEKCVIRNGAIVKNSCVQWGCVIDSLAIVDHSLITEHAHVERHGKVTHCIIGPNTGIAEGEATSSLIGPFVGFHHQSLLIGALWPQGKGNVAYGANVGSNHTAKAPDQELYCGEGLFFGLGTNIKFPSDFTGAPYSIIATGVTTLPQRMAFPFSLINTPGHHHPDISPAINELVPAWVLSDNFYLLKRNEMKFASRNKALRTTISYDIFRPEIMDVMCTALERLENAPDNKAIYSNNDIPGIGKNFVTAKNVARAIATYRLHLEHYCLMGLFQYLHDPSAGRNPLITTSIFEDAAIAAPWSHYRTTFLKLGFAPSTPALHLDRLITIEEQIVSSIITSKEKDALRGRKIIEDYDLFHKEVSEETFISEVTASFEELKRDVEELKTTCLIQ